MVGAVLLPLLIVILPILLYHALPLTAREFVVRWIHRIKIGTTAIVMLIIMLWCVVMVLAVSYVCLYELWYLLKALLK